MWVKALAVLSSRHTFTLARTAPQGLIEEDIYKEIAIALHTPPHRAVSLRASPLWRRPWAPPRTPHGWRRA